MEALSCLLKRAKVVVFCRGGLVRGRGREEMDVSHLLFSNRILVFCEPSPNQLTHLSWVLIWFEVMLGLRINLEKSELLLVGRVENIRELAQEFGCKVGVFPSTYLGLPLGALFKSMVVWDSVEERFQKRLALWKVWYISKEGRETYPNSQHSVQLAYLFNVLILYAKISWAKVGVNSKRLPLERRGPLEETSLG